MLFLYIQKDITLIRIEPQRHKGTIGMDVSYCVPRQWHCVFVVHFWVHLTHVIYVCVQHCQELVRLLVSLLVVRCRACLGHRIRPLLGYHGLP